MAFRVRSFLYFAIAVLLLASASVSAFSVTNSRVGTVARNYAGYTFDLYVEEFGKRYRSDDERTTRKELFEKNLAAIVVHNCQPGVSYVKGVNDMTDWSENEFLALNGLRPHMRSHTSVKHLKKPFVRSSQALPYQVDYRTAVPPVLTAIKNQGNCGSCWAHAAVQGIESHWAISTGNLNVLSQQQLTSCTPNPRHCGGTGGCEGSVDSLAYEYAHQVGGVAEEWTYPYTSFNGNSGVCDNYTGTHVAKVKGFVEVPKDDQQAMMQAVAFVGPISVSVAANGWSAYSGGIFNGCNYARNITQNHAVQLVGYGHDLATRQDYWIIRNSWGTRWGENGYMRLLRENEPSCGWSVDTHSGSACDGDPDEEWVCGVCGVLSGATYPIV